MWQRFTEQARRVVFFAQEEAGILGLNEVNPDHILLGLLREDKTITIRVFELLGVSAGRIRHMIERETPRGELRRGQDMQLSAGGKRVIDLAFEEAQKLGSLAIDGEHLLLAVLREEESVASRTLKRLGVDMANTSHVLQALREGRPVEAAGPGYKGGVGSDVMKLILKAEKERNRLNQDEVSLELLAKALIQENRELVLRLLNETKPDTNTG